MESGVWLRWVWTLLCIGLMAPASIGWPQVVINEVDSDNTGADTLEFIELYDGGVGNLSLDGLVVVFFNGSSDTSYRAIDLDGYRTDANGFFVIGNAGVAGVQVIFPDGSLQNGADAVAIFAGNRQDFPNGTTITTDDLVDAVVYGTADPDDPQLLSLITNGSQVDESSEAGSGIDSCQRCPDGGGGPRNLAFFLASPPTPGSENKCWPTVDRIRRDGPSPSNANTVRFAILFSEPITGIDLNDLMLNTTGTVTGAQILGVTGSDDYYTVDVVTGSGDGVIGLNLMDDDTIVNAYHRPLGGVGLGNGDHPADESFIIDHTPPEIHIQSPQPNLTHNGPITYDLTYIGAHRVHLISNLIEVQATGTASGTVQVLNGSTATPQVLITDISGTGTLRIRILSDTAWDEAGNMAPATDLSEPVVVAPDVIINEIDANTSGTDTEEFIELFDGGLGNTPLDGLVLVFFNGSDDRSYFAIDLDNQATNSNGYFVIGNAAVAEASMVIPNGLIQNGADAVALFVGDDMNFPNGTEVTTQGVVSAVVYGTDDPDDPELLLLMDDGIQADEDGGHNSQQAALQRCPNGSGQPRQGAPFSPNPPTPGRTNDCGPGVLSIACERPTPTGASQLTFIVTFDQEVFGVDEHDFSLNVSGTITDAVISGISGSGTTWTINVDTGQGDGILGLDLLDNDSIVNSAGTPLGGTFPGNGDFTAGDPVTVDKTPPHIQIGPPSPDVTFQGPITIPVTYTAADQIQLTAQDISLQTTGSAHAVVTVFNGHTANPMVQLDQITGNGTLGIRIGPGTATDLAGNRAPATDALSQAVVYAPVIINEVDSDTAGTDDAEFVELYDGGVGNTDLTGLVLVFFNGDDTIDPIDGAYLAMDLDGFATNPDGYFVICGDAGRVSHCHLDADPDTNLIQNGPDAIALYVGDDTDFPNGTPPSTARRVDAIVYDNGSSEDTVLMASLLHPGQPQVKENRLGNTGINSSQRCPNGSGGGAKTETFAQYPPSPGLPNACGTLVTVESIGPDTASPTRMAFADFHVVFSENVTGVDESDFRIFSQGQVSGASVSGIHGNGREYRVTVTTGIGDGSIRLNLVDDDSIVSDSGGYLGGPGPGNGDFHSGDLLAIDKTPPMPPSVPDLMPISDTGLSDADNITSDIFPGFSGSGEPFSRIEIVSDRQGVVGSGIVDATGIWEVVSDRGLDHGMHQIQATARDLAGNTSQCPSVLEMTIDSACPVGTIEPSPQQENPVSTGPIRFTVHFGEPVFGFDPAQIRLSGTAGADTVTISGNGQVFEMVVSGMDQPGTVKVGLIPNGARDLAGNGVVAGSSEDVQVVYAPKPPTVRNIARSDPDPTSAGEIHFKVTFDQPVAGVDATDFQVSVTGTISGAIASVSPWSDTSVIVTIRTSTGQGTVGLNLVDNDSIVNALGMSLAGTGPGNGNIAGPAYTVDRQSPVVTRVTSPMTGSTAIPGDTIAFHVQFDEPVVVNGIPELALEMVDCQSVAIYSVGSGSTVLRFLYTVVQNHWIGPLTYCDIHALHAEPGTIVDALGNPANLQLPAPGTPDSLSDNCRIEVDGKPRLVINEVQPYFQGFGSQGFIEMKNISDDPVMLDGYRLVLESGPVGQVQVSDPMDLDTVILGPDDYYVVCHPDSAQMTNCDQWISSDIFLRPDTAGAIILKRRTVEVDAVRYGGNMPEVTDFSIGRFPDGFDTDQDHSDFIAQCPSPGAANPGPTSPFPCTGPTEPGNLPDSDTDSDSLSPVSPRRSGWIVGQYPMVIRPQAAASIRSTDLIVEQAPWDWPWAYRLIPGYGQNYSKPILSWDGHRTYAMAVADINGDGNVDVIAANGGHCQSINRIYINNGTATPFRGVIGENLGHKKGDTRALAVADIDSDGDTDILIGLATGTIRIVLNHGDKNPFDHDDALEIAGDSPIVGLLTADLNHDDRPDLVVARQESIGWLRNQGTPDPFLSDSEIWIASCNSVTCIAAADMNLDGWTDLVVGRDRQPCLIFIHDESLDELRFQPPVALTENVFPVSSLAVADLNQDQYPDVVLGNRANQPNRLYLNPAMGNPMAPFKGIDISRDRHYTMSIAAADINGDGYVDVIAGNGHGHRNRFYLNNGTELPFSNVEGSDLAKEATDTRSVAVADLDADGDMDIVTGNMGMDKRNRIYLNNGRLEDPFADIASADTTIMPAAGFTGILQVPVMIFHGHQIVDIFPFTIQVERIGED